MRTARSVHRIDRADIAPLLSLAARMKPQKLPGCNRLRNNRAMRDFMLHGTTVAVDRPLPRARNRSLIFR
jgi:hypothetical protein